MTAFSCTLDSPGSESVFADFTRTICGEGTRRHAVIAGGPHGPRCVLQNCGRCIAHDTPWRMARAMVEPLLRFDPTIEWIALLPVENWGQRCDRALEASFAADKPWMRLLAEELEAELASVPHLVVRRA